MRAVLQRVSSASVEVEGKTVGEIGKGFLVLLGVSETDTQREAKALAEKIVNLRIFSDEKDKMNFSLADVDGKLLVVSNFTLYADCRKGRRPSYIQAARPDQAENLFEYFKEYLRNIQPKQVESGIFGADMKVKLVNDGPVTICLDTDELIPKEQSKE